MISEKFELNRIKKLVDKVDGWLTYKEGELLYNLAKKCTGKGAIVEIGSWKGKSTIWLGMGSNRGKKAKVYAIDPHTGSSEHKEFHDKVWTFEEFKKNIENANLNNVIVPVLKTSEEAAKIIDRPIELIFIDGAHEYDLAILDFELWFPKVIDGGIMAFHDSVTIDWLGSKKVVEELVYKSNNFRNVNLIDSITIAEKVKQNSIKDRLRNVSLLRFKNIYELIIKIVLILRVPISIRKIGKRIIEISVNIIRS